MASNLVQILEQLKTALEGVDGVGGVETYPPDPDTWLETLLPGQRGVVLHLAVQESSATRLTCGSYQESMTVMVTVAIAGQEYGVAQMISLRDAIIEALEADQTLGGYTSLVTWTGFRTIDAREYLAPFRLTFTMDFEWEA
jgi:hypothetical protein